VVAARGACALPRPSRARGRARIRGRRRECGGRRVRLQARALEGELVAGFKQLSHVRLRLQRAESLAALAREREAALAAELSAVDAELRRRGLVGSDRRARRRAHRRARLRARRRA